MTLYHVNVTVHVLAALVWLGGMLFFALVGAPVLRAVEPPELRSRLFRMLGERFRRVGWLAVGVLVVTGTLNLHSRGVLAAGTLLDGGFWGTRYGVALAWKLGAVAAMLAVQAMHDFVAGPAASRLPAASPALPRARRRAALLGRASAVLGVVVVVAAVRLARGG
jgi:putative copper resistance protein D